jgi:hypothetical protein
VVVVKRDCPPVTVSFGRRRRRLRQMARDGPFSIAHLSRVPSFWGCSGTSVVTSCEGALGIVVSIGVSF